MAANLSDRLSHAKDVAQWKIDQQSRILKTQNKIGDFERQAGKQKALLAEKTFELYKDKKFKNGEIDPLCEELVTIYSALEEAQKELESIKNEQPPELSEGFKPADMLSGYVCPVCGKKLTGKYCPDHGVEGVKQEQSEPVSESGLVCPKCGKPVPVKFCVNCGIEGVPVKKPEAKTSPEKGQKTENDTTKE